jgi:uncharacterized protein
MTDEADPVVKSVEASLRLEFYGNLLTERSRRLMELHFDEDLSYAEIAEQMGTSRQSVHDGVSRAVAQLAEYEEKLGLVVRFGTRRRLVEDALRLLSEGREDDAARQLKILLDEL